MDKLINYEDLGSFRENLVNDSSISEKTTWSSDKLSSNFIDVSTELANKANISDVSTELANKANISDVSTELANKANTSYVNTLLAKKQNALNQTNYDNISLSGNKLNAKGYYYYNTTNGILLEGAIDVAKEPGQKSISGGNMSWAQGNYTIAEGNNTNAFGDYSHSEGYNTNAIGAYSHAEGYSGHYTEPERFSGDANATQYTTTLAHHLYVGDFLRYKNVIAKVIEVVSSTSFVVDKTLSSTRVVNGQYQLIDGLAYGESSHVEGAYTTAEGTRSHAEGTRTLASGQSSHAEGFCTETTNYAEHAEGSVNKSHKNSDIQIDFQHPNGDEGNTIHSIGIGYEYGLSGTTQYLEKNALEVMQNGDAYLYGVGGYDGIHIKNEDPSINVQTVQEVINANLPQNIIDNDSIIIDSSNHIAVSSDLINYITSLETRIYALEHPTTVE